MASAAPRSGSPWPPLPSNRSVTLRRRASQPITEIAGRRPGTVGLPVGGVAGLFGAGAGEPGAPGSASPGGGDAPLAGRLGATISASALAATVASASGVVRRTATPAGSSSGSASRPSGASGSGSGVSAGSWAGDQGALSFGGGPGISRSSGAATVLRKAEGAPAAAASTAAATVTDGPAPPLPPVGSTTDLLDNIDALLETLEERIIAQLERRGLRLGGIF